MMLLRQKYIDMTEGPIAQKLVSYAVPLLLGDILQQLYNTVDIMIVGNFVSKQALAAIGATATIVNVLIGMFTGLSIGATVIVSRFFGARDKSHLSEAVRTTIWLTVVLGILFTIIGVLTTPFMLRLLGTPNDVYDIARLYLQIYFAGISGLVMYNMLTGILRAIGDLKRPLYVLLLSSLTNIALDFLFIIRYSMGVAGAAMATIISQFISVVILLIIMGNTKEICGRQLFKPCFNKSVLKETIYVGFPIGIQKSVISFSNTLVISYINTFGSNAMAAWSIYLRIDQIIMRTIQSMSTAMTTFTAQNIGAGRQTRVRQGSRVAALLTAGTVVIYATIFVVFRSSLIKLFNQDSGVIYYGTSALTILPILQVCNVYSQIKAGELRGMGDSSAPMLILIFSYVVCRQVYLYIGWRFVQTYFFVIASYPVTWLISSLIMFFYDLKRNPRIYQDSAD